jgi:predicted HTH transcriptional regulator/formylglycine-generating enzyme required for sulfatase activity
MRPEDIRKNLALGAVSPVEFMAAFEDIDATGRIVCGFLNTVGGYLVCGVNEQGEAQGIDTSSEFVQTLEKNFYDKLSPKSMISVQVQELEEATVIVVEVPAGQDKPYSFNSVIYIRVDGRTEKADGQAIRDMVIRHQIEPERWERRFSTADIDADVDIKVVRTAVAAAQNVRRAYFRDRESPVRVLEDFSVARYGRLTNAGDVLFATDPALRLPQTRLRAYCYNTDKAGDRYSDMKSFEGPLSSLLEDAYTFVVRNTPTVSRFIEGEAKRQDVPLYPELAIREALVNALAHRDYSAYSGGVAVHIYPQRLVISNSGAFPEGINEERFAEGYLSVLRNPDIAHVLYLQGYMEKAGRGTVLMIKECNDNSLPKPGWKSDKDLGVTVTFSAVEIIDGKQKSYAVPQPFFHELDRRYRAMLTGELNTIRLLGSPAIESVQVRLDDTFVPLRISHTWKTDERFKGKMRETVMQEEVRPHSPDELMRRVFPAYRMLLVIGDPGAGKTTLLKYYALCCLQNKQSRLFGDGALMVRVFYLPLRELKLDDSMQYRSLPEQLALWSSARANSIDANVFDGWLRNAGGSKSLVLLDGLDEISDLELRKAACQWIDRQHTGFPETFFVVTSRLTGYRKTEGVELSADHIRADVMDFTPIQQEEFLSKWFKAAYLRELCPFGLDSEEWIASQSQKAEERTRTITEYLGKPDNRGLRELAAVPMMLQIMAILWKEREFLPGNRVKLYSAALDYLLEYRDDRRKITPLMPADKARLVLAPVALWMQEELEADEAERTAMYSEMQKVLSTLDRPPSAEDFCKNLVDRAGLLVEYGEKRREYLFRHKTFREYLAGVQLVKTIRRDVSSLDIMVKHFGEDWWSETLIFSMAQADAEIFDRFMQELFDSEGSDELSPKQQNLLQTIIAEAPQKPTAALCRKLLEPDTTDNRQRYILDCLRTLGKATAVDDVNLFLARGLAKSEDIRGRAEELVAALSSSGETTGCLSANESDFVLISGGRYLYSGTGAEVLVPDLFVAKYPVTNRDYRSFIGFLAGKSGAHDQLLSHEVYKEALVKLARSGDATVQGLKDYLKDEPDLVQRFRSAYDDDRKFSRDEQPVVGVSWYDARAYCLWLSMLSGEEYRLPTEQEWEWAAGGRREEAGRVLKVKEYPWGDKPEPTPKHANFNGNEGATTPVGRYPDGATPEGLYDMAGNVWEWMENGYESTIQKPSLRSGSWVANGGWLRCTSRNYNDPSNRSNDIGFRVVRRATMI